MPSERAEDENNLPKATVDKMIQEVLPKNLSMAKITKEKVKLACQLFIDVVSIEANKACELENKKTITNSHICQGLEELGFGAYIDVCQQAALDYSDYAKLKPSRQNKFKESGLTMDELHEDQMKLFNEAKKAIFKEYEVQESEDSLPKDV
ncbi:down-regulator of transcription 1 [Enteropsectra breve]|nr:down-regulator of transcription 1 [Enteropsectra breve]